MSITYSITETEFQEYVKSVYKKGVFNKKNIWIYAFITVAFIAFNYNSCKDEEGNFNLAPLLSWLMFLVLFIVLWVLLMKLLRVTVLKNVKKEDHELLLGERTMTFDTDKVQTKGASAETTYQWDAIKRWEQTKSLYLLYISSNAAIIIPKRVFATATEVQDFETLLKTKIQNLTNEKYLDA